LTKVFKAVFYFTFFPAITHLESVVKVLNAAYIPQKTSSYYFHTLQDYTA